MSKPIFLVVLLVLTACSHVAIKPPENYTPDDFWKGQEAKAQIGESFLGKMNLSVTDEAGSARGMGQIVSVGPAKSRIEVRDPLGRMQFLVILNGDEFSAYYPDRKKVYQDKHKGLAYFSKALGINLNFSQLQAIFLGHVEPLLKEKFKDWKWDDKKGVYVVKAKSELGPLRLRIDPKHNVPVSAISDRDDIEVTYSGHKQCCGKWPGGSLRMSHELEILSHRTKASIQVNWKSFEPVPKGIQDKAFQPSFPDGTTPVPLR